MGDVKDVLDPEEKLRIETESKYLRRKPNRRERLLPQTSRPAWTRPLLPSPVSTT